MNIDTVGWSDTTNLCGECGGPAARSAFSTTARLTLSSDTGTKPPLLLVPSNQFRRTEELTEIPFPLRERRLASVTAAN